MILIVIHFGQAASTLPVRSAWHRLGAALIQWTQNNWRPATIHSDYTLTEAIDIYSNLADMID